MHILDLPNELILEIIGWLPCPVTFAATCKRLLPFKGDHDPFDCVYHVLQILDCHHSYYDEDVLYPSLDSF